MFFAVAISLDIVRIKTCKPHFKVSVLLCVVGVRAQIISYRQMSYYVKAVVFVKNMDLVRASVAAFTQIAPAGYSEFAHIFVARFFKIFRSGVNGFEAFYDGHDVYYRFCRQSGHRRRAYVVNGNGVIAENIGNNLFFTYKGVPPRRVVFCYDYDLRHNFSRSALRAAVCKKARTFKGTGIMERKTGFEPATFGLGSRRSTVEPFPHGVQLL